MFDCRTCAIYYAKGVYLKLTLIATTSVMQDKVRSGEPNLPLQFENKMF
jgi:hypothetical protein